MTRWMRLLLVIGNIVMLNLLLLRTGWQWDATQERLHTLSPELPALLQNLPDGARLTFVASEQKQHAALKPLVRQVQDLLRHFREASAGRLQVEFIDPIADPTKIGYVENQLGVRRFPTPTADGGQAMVFFGLVTQVGTQSEVLSHQLVRPADANSYVLVNFEGQVLRALHQVARRQQSLHEAVHMSGQLRLMPVFDDELPDPLKAVKALVGGVISDLVASYGTGKVTLDEARLDDPAFLAKLDRAGLRRWSIPNFGEAWCHLLVHRKAPGDTSTTTIEIPGLPYLKSAKEAREWIEQYILLSLDQGGRQLGLLLPPNTKAQPDGRPGSGYERLIPAFQGDYNVKLLKPPLQAIPPGIEVILAMGLATVDPDTVREVDKFLMRGGKLVLFASQAQFVPGRETGQLARFRSGWEPLLERWGIGLTGRTGASEQAVTMSWPRRRLGERLDFESVETALPWTPVVRVTPEMAQTALPLAGIEGVVLNYPTSLDLDGNTRALTVTPLLAGGAESWAAVTPDAVFPFDPEGGTLRPARQAWDENEPVFGVLLEGSFVHYETPGVTEDYVRPQSPPTRVAVVGDHDMLDDNFWTPQWRGLETVELTSRLADNWMFTRNLVDWAFGDDDILKVSSRVARSRDIDPAAREPSAKTRAALKALGIPLVALLLVGVWRWRRRSAR